MNVVNAYEVFFLLNIKLTTILLSTDDDDVRRQDYNNVRYSYADLGHTFSECSFVGYAVAGVQFFSSLIIKWVWQKPVVVN